MSRKKSNANAGKIINVAEFETAFSELQESQKESFATGLLVGARAALYGSTKPKSPVLGKMIWPVIYTRDTAAETAQALAEMKQWPVTIKNKDKPPVKKTLGELEYGEPAGPIIEDFTKIPTARVPVSADKTYFEASNFMATLKQYGCLSQAFKKAVEKCADHRDMLKSKGLSEAHSPNDSGYTITIDRDTNKVEVQAFVVPEGNHRNTRVLGGKTIRTVKTSKLR